MGPHNRVVQAEHGQFGIFQNGPADHARGVKHYAAFLVGLRNAQETNGAVSKPGKILHDSTTIACTACPLYELLEICG